MVQLWILITKPLSLDQSLCTCLPGTKAVLPETAATAGLISLSTLSASSPFDSFLSPSQQSFVNFLPFLAFQWWPKIIDLGSSLPRIISSNLIVDINQGLYLPAPCRKEDISFASGTSQSYDTGFGKPLQIVSAFKISSNSVSEHYLSGVNIKLIAFFSAVLCFFRLLVKDLSEINFSSGTICNKVNLYCETFKSAQCSVSSVSTSAVITRRKPFNVYPRSARYLLRLAAKLNHTTWTGYKTVSLNFRDVTVLSGYTRISSKKISADHCRERSTESHYIQTHHSFPSTTFSQPIMLYQYELPATSGGKSLEQKKNDPEWAGSICSLITMKTRSIRSRLTAFFF